MVEISKFRPKIIYFGHLDWQKLAGVALILIYPRQNYVENKSLKKLLIKIAFLFSTKVFEEKNPDRFHWFLTLKSDLLVLVQSPLFGCHIDAAEQQMAWNFELVLSD